MSEKINFKKTILLTGAGFTANFGGLLSREMWSKIYNHIELDNYPKIKKLLQSNFDFEEIYSKVKNGTAYTDEEKRIFQKIILDSYKDMDETIKNYTFTAQDPYGVNIYGVGRLLSLLSGQSGDIGVCFTLNQDLFMEKQFKRRSLGLVGPQYKEYLEQTSTGKFDFNKPVQLPSQDYIDDFKITKLSHLGNDVFIKLHGSLGWHSISGADQMILGINKLEDIQKEPLLKWYFELFNEAISRSDVKLFIIGYGFRDDHVNNLIIKAIENHNIKLYIISAENPEKFKDRFIYKQPPTATIREIDKNHLKIWESINGYFPYKLKEIFPSDQSESHFFRDIKKILSN